MKNKISFLKIMSLSAAAICLCSFGTGALAADMSPKDIMTKNEDIRKITDVISKAKLTTGGGDSTERIKEFTWWRKLISDGVHYNTLTRFQFPPEVKGEGILFLEHAGDQTDVQMYLPNFKKIRRVESQQQSGSFMGSEFSYADIATPHANDYSYTMQKDEEACMESGKAYKCYVIEAIPANDAIKERTGTSKSVYWIRKDIFMAVKAEYYDAGGAIWKRMEASENKEVDTKTHKWMAMHVRMENAKNQHFTVLQFEDVKVGPKIPDSTFTPANLQRDK